jgi:uncharacterized protein (TIGR02246 family)
MHTRIRTRRLLVLALPLLFGVATAEADEPADRAALEAASQAWAAAFNGRDADGMIALATPDVVAIEPNAAPASGRDAVRAAWSRAACAARSRMTIATKEIVVTGALAWKISAVTHTQPGGAVVGRSHLLEIWQKADGRWKIHRQLSSGELAGRPALQPRPVPPEPVLDKPVN